MKKFIKKRKLQIILILVLILAGWYVWYCGGKPIGKKIIMAYRPLNGEYGFYTITPTYLGNNKQLYFATPEYEEIKFFEVHGENILFSGRKKGQQEFVVVDYKNKKLEEVCTSSKPIEWAVWSKENEELLCLLLEDKGKRLGYLYRYNLKEKAFQKVLNEMLPAFQKALVTPTGEIIFVTEARKPYEIINEICILHNDDRIEKLVQHGRGLCWNKKGESFFYIARGGGTICEYNINEQKSRIVVKEADAGTRLAVSPDKKYVAFIECGLWNGVETSALCVGNTENGTTREIDNLKQIETSIGSIGWLK